MRLALLILLGLIAVGYAWLFVRGLSPARIPQENEGLPEESTPDRSWTPTWMQTVIGCVTNFFDALGIGNFAPTTAWFRATMMVPDEHIPGTLNVGHTLPVIVMAFLFIDIIEVEEGTLIAMIAAAAIGAWLGAGVVSRLPRRSIQIGMGIALLLAAAFMTLDLFGVTAVGGQALGLESWSLVFAAAAIGILGALMTIGVGLYAPCMVLISMLGMNPKAAFPIMMGACAFLMPVASARFIEERRYSARPAVGLTLGGIPGVLIAVWIVGSMDLEILKTLVVLIVVLTALMMLRSAFTKPVASVTGQTPQD
jgi:uncharacterized membrane protein YfcA